LHRPQEESTLVQIDRHGSHLEELDVEGIIAFAERVLPRTADAVGSTVANQRQRLQPLMFPEGVAFNGKRFDRTAVTSSAFKYVRPIEDPIENLVDQTGVEPVTS
jgi:hypothetical protein